MTTPTVDVEQGAPWYLRLGAWIGVGTAPGALMAGGGIAASTSGTWRLPAVVIGVIALVTLAVLGGRQGYATRIATVGLARRAFGGGLGERLVALLITVGVCGWCGIYIGVCAGALQQLWGIPPLVTGMSFGALMLVVYLAGFKRWNLLVGLTGAASIGVAALVTRSVIAAPGTSPGARLQGPAALVFGAGVVVAYAAVFALRAADFTWDARRSADVVRAGVVLGVAVLVFLLLGVEIYNRAGSFDLSTLVNQTALPVFGVLLLLLASIAPSVSGMHSGALAVHSLLKWSPRAGAAFTAAGSGALGAARVDLHLLGVIGLLGAALPPLIGVLLMHRSREPGWHAWVSWGAGSGVSLALLLADFPASVLVGILTSAATMFVLGLLPTSAKERSHG